MTEQELLEKIKASADTVSVPETLSPDTVRQKLEKEREKLEKEQRRKKKYRKKIASVAAIAMVCLGGSVAAYSHWHGAQPGEDTGMFDTAMEAEGVSDSDAVMGEDAGGNAQNIAADNETAGSNIQDAVANNGTVGSSDAGEQLVLAAKQDAGDMYVVAENYGEVYDLLNAYYDEVYYQYETGAVDDVVREEAALPEKNSFSTPVSNGMAASDSVEEIVAEDSISKEMADMSTAKEYSGTNLQTQGVDESDIIKTDGSYIYTVSGSRVIITDVRKAKMKQAGEIEVSMNSASDQVLEMYVDGDTLNLIVQKESTDLEKRVSDNRDIPDIDRETTYMDVENIGMVPVEDVYYFNSKVETEVQTYDITDRTKPVLKGAVAQDGYYKTSRKIGEIVYLFTEKVVNRPELTRGTAILEDSVRGWIPLVAGKAVAADCIYIPESGNNGLIISSVNVKKPEEVVDNTLILNNYVDIYVSNGALYLYGQDYSTPGGVTQIAKFALKKGAINAVGAVTAKGQVRDTFAINEYNGKLRLLTTDWSNGQAENGLYLFDEKLKLTGKLEGLAKGEEIYAARYFGNTAYFVTYRNTDPLFAVDLTDEKNPKVLSELKITGFSEYLHFWGKDKLLGIGYETDPDSGERKGLKLTMFDISNPAKLKTAGTCVIKDIDSSPALYNYKCVLADETENLIGFATETYGMRGEQKSYLLFAWENGDFKNLMTENLADGAFVEGYRGIYIGDTFYLAERDSIASYDRKDDYRMLEMLELK